MPRITIPWKTHYYYFNHLDETEKPIYQAILRGLLEWKDEIHIPDSLDFDRVYEIFTMVQRDFPTLFHINNHLRGKSGKSLRVFPEYTMSDAEYQEKLAAVQHFLNNCQQQLEGRSAFDRLRIMHDAIRKHVIYHDTKTANKYNILGTILDRKAVCESISKAYKLMCDVNRIPAIVVFGSAIGSNSSVPKDEHSESTLNQDRGHAWNMVKLDGEWYNVDVTYDLKNKDSSDHLTFYYDYFLCSDTRFATNHQQDQDMVLPQCMMDYEFHRRKGRYITELSQVSRMAEDVVKAGFREIVFQVAPICQATSSELADEVSRGLSFTKHSGFYYSYNQNMRIFRAELN